MNRSLSVLSVLSVLALTACSVDTPSSPVVGLSRTSPAYYSTPTGKHLVYFDGVGADVADRVTALGGSVDASFDEAGVAIVNGLSNEAAVDLASQEGITAVNPDREYQFDLPGAPEVEAAAADVVIASPTAPQTAFFFPRQWHLRQIGAHQMWAMGHLGSPTVRVAILDTGIDYLHADLNGRVDLSRSASFIPSDDAIVASMFPGRHRVTDLHYHGTHVAATVSSNALAAAGVTSQTTLIGVKVLSRTGSGSTSGILAGIMHAVDNGANIINMSLGISSPLPDVDFQWFIDMTNVAFQYAYDKGVTVVVAAGNEAYNVDTKGNFKAYCEAVNVICVSATGPTAQGSVNGPWTDPDAPAPYTNFGRRSISVAGPGGAASAVWAACSGTSLAIPVCRTGTFVVGLAGTSMASPHTAGLAALILAKRPVQTPREVRNRVEGSTDDLGPKGRDDYYGRGRINLVKSLGL